MIIIISFTDQYRLIVIGLLILNKDICLCYVLKKIKENYFRAIF